MNFGDLVSGGGNALSTPDTINSDLDTPLNDLLYIMDYKQFGENSGVFQNKDALKRALMTWYAVNDLALRNEAAVSAESNNQVGELLAKQYGINQPQLKQYKTFDAIKRSSDKSILDELYLPNGKLRWLFDGSILTDDFYIPETVRSLYYDNDQEAPVQAAVNTFYNAYSDEFASTFEKAMEVYNMPSVWKNTFWNQTWLSKLFNSLNDAGEVRSTSASLSGMDNHESKSTTSSVLSCKAVLRVNMHVYGSSFNSNSGYCSNNSNIMVEGGATCYNKSISAGSYDSKNSDEYLFIPTNHAHISLVASGYGSSDTSASTTLYVT